MENKLDWFFCFSCGTPSLVCPQCGHGICTGGCAHADEYFKIEPKFWDENKHPDFDAMRQKLIDNGEIDDYPDFKMTNEKAREEIRKYNEMMGYKGVLRLKDVKKI